MPYVGEIRLFAGNFAPAGWLVCNGQLLSTTDNELLFMAIGTTYGGDGEQTFALPDLRGRAPIHQGTLSGRSFGLAEMGGAEEVTLTPAQIPTHSHWLQGVSKAASTQKPYAALLADTGQSNALQYGTASPTVPLAPGTLSSAGGNQPHANVQPFQAINYIVATLGAFPSPNGGGAGPDDAYLGEIRIFPYDFAPSGWAPCWGQLMPVTQNTALFSILGINYGGDGRSSFALPNLRAATPIGAGQGPGLSNRSIGESGGQVAVPLTPANLPGHAHSLVASAAPGTSSGPAGQLPATSESLAIYGAAEQLQPMSNAAIGTEGQGKPHNNVQPYLALNLCIALQGVYPTRA